MLQASGGSVVQALPVASRASLTGGATGERGVGRGRRVRQELAPAGRLGGIVLAWKKGQSKTMVLEFLKQGGCCDSNVAGICQLEVLRIFFVQE